MKKWHLYIFLTLFSLLSHSANAQIDSIRKIKPILTLVSVQPETGFTELSWDPIPSSVVSGFRTLYYIKDFGGFFRFGTLLNPTTLNSIDPSRFSNFYSESYVIEAIDSSGNPSPLSNELNTIFTETSVDTCNKKILVSWNKYTSYPKKVTGYSILVSVNGVKSDSANVIPEKNSFTYDFITDAAYCFVVRANLEGGVFSTSNKACASPGVCTVPPVIIIVPPEIITESPEIITVPNVLISNSFKGNNLFIPVLSFIPKDDDYYLIISDRRGNILFETKDYKEVWDCFGNGNGVYLWFLKVTTPSGKSISKTGTVTIINNPE